MTMMLLSGLLGGLIAYVVMHYIRPVPKDDPTERYEKGWSDGYDVGVSFAEEKYETGWEDGHRSAQFAAKSKSRKAKTITPTKEK